MTERSRLEVGRVTKAHGLKGEVVVDLVSDYPEVRLAPGSRLWTGEQELVVRSSRPFQQRWLVHVEGVHDRTGAERLAGRTLTAEPLEDPEALWVHQLIGSRVVEQGSGAERGASSPSSPTRPTSCWSWTRVRWSRSSSCNRARTGSP